MTLRLSVGVILRNYIIKVTLGLRTRHQIKEAYVNNRLLKTNCYLYMAKSVNVRLQFFFEVFKIVPV